MEAGQLDRAEIPLDKAHRGESEEGTLALADLLHQRGQPADLAVERQLRWEAPAIDKANSEFTVWYRPGTPRGSSVATAINLQPMFLLSRRLNVGAELVWSQTAVSEVAAFAGYQHYFTDVWVGYANLLAGNIPAEAPGRRFDVGADLGVKVSWRSYGGLNLGVGSSTGSPLHASVGVFVNGLVFWIPLLLAGSR